MAKGNPILGTMQGTIGDVTTYNYNGKQVTRVRRRTIRNPRTSKQAIQRTIASTVAKFVSAFAPVLNNSLQNEGSKVSTLAKIRSLNMNMLRQQAAANEGTYTPKGTMYVAPNNYIISRGSLPGLTVLSDATSIQDLEEGRLNFPENSLIISATLTASQAFPAVSVGDQFTFLAANLEDIAEGSHVAYCRFAFKDDTTPVFISDTQSEKWKLNPAAIDLTKAEGPWASLIFDDDSVFLSKLVDGNNGDPVNMAGIIISREAGKLRSSAHMVSKAASDYTLANVYPTYMDGGTLIDIPSDIYLNNDANVV